MKKLSILLISMMFLSGCSATNGIVSESDVENLNYENIGSMENIQSILEEQKNISYIPDDVKEFLEKIEEAEKNQGLSEYGYLDINNVVKTHSNNLSNFLYETHLSGARSDEEEKEFKSLVDILDQTISKGIKLYIDKNINEDIGDGIQTKIGRTWISINPIDRRLDSEASNLQNSVTLVIKIKDIKNEEYKEIIKNISGDDLILDSIKIGNKQNLIELSNVEYKNDFTLHELKKPSISYQLFIENNKVDKVRLIVESASNEKISDNFKSLSKLSEELKFDIEDMKVLKVLEEIKILIKENKEGKKTLSSDKFNFSYRNLENNRFIYGPYESRNLTEVVIERK